MESNAALEPTLLGAMWRYRWLVLACVVLAGLAQSVYQATRRPQYTAAAALVVTDPTRESSLGTVQPNPELDGRYVSDQIQLLRSPRVAERAAALAKERAPDAGWGTGRMLGATQVTGSNDANLIFVRFKATDPSQAQVGANAMADAYQELRSAETKRYAEGSVQRINSTLAAIDVQRAELIARIRTNPPELPGLQADLTAGSQRRAQLAARRDELNAQAQLASSGVTSYSPAPLPPTAQPKLAPRDAGIAGMFGLLLGAALAYFLALRNRIVRNATAAKMLVGAPVLGAIPDFRQEGVRSAVPMIDAADSVSAETYRFAATLLEGPLASGSTTILAVTAGNAGSGSSVTAANLALAVAGEGKRVLVVDTDFGRSELSELLLTTPPGGPGLTEVVEQGMAPRAAVRDVGLAHAASLSGYLHLLSSGELKVSPDSFFRSTAIQACLDRLRGEYDLVVLDTPPLLEVAYSMSVIRAADAVVLVIAHGGQAAQVEESGARLRLAGTPVVGCIYNMAPLRGVLAVRQSMSAVSGYGAQDQPAVGSRARASRARSPISRR